MSLGNRHPPAFMLGLSMVFTLWSDYGLYCYKLTCRYLMAFFTCNFSSPVKMWELLTLHRAAKHFEISRRESKTDGAMCSLKAYVKEVNIPQENLWRQDFGFKVFQFAFRQWQKETSKSILSQCSHFLNFFFFLIPNFCLQFPVEGNKDFYKKNQYTAEDGDRNCEDNPTLIVISPSGKGRLFIPYSHRPYCHSSSEFS